MPDMLVKLYDLPDAGPAFARQESQGISIRRALASEKRNVLAWVSKHWGASWASECDIAFSRQPVSCLLALRDERILGFACYETTYRGFFGPTGVLDSAQGRGTGTALLLAALHAMRGLGYGYAIVGGVGPEEYYAKTVGAVTIPGSDPGIYAGTL